MCLGLPLALNATPLTIPELIAIAMENNTETRQAWWNARRAAAAVGCAKSAYYPQLYLNGNLSHGRDFKFVNGPDTNYTIGNADVILAMLLLDFGERAANVESARMVLLAADWKNDWIIQKVMVRVLENAYGTLHAQETLQATLSSLADADNMFKIAGELNRVGLNPVSDLYTSQATYSQMQMEAAQKKAQLDIQKGKLASSMGLNADTSLQLASLDVLPPPPKQLVGDLIALAKQQRADLAAKEALVADSFARLDKARAGYYPKLSLESRGGYDHALHDHANGAHYRVAVNLEIPLFSGFDTVYKNRMAYADTETTTEELRQLELDIALEVLTCSRNLEAAQEMLAYADDNLNSALKAYDAVLEKYKAGKERITDVSFVQRQLAAARVLHSDVKTRYLVAMANLAYATGSLGDWKTMENTCATAP